MEEQGTWAAQKHSEAGYGRPVDRGVWTAKTVKRPRQQPEHPQYANYWALLTRKRHTMPHPAQPRHTNYWAPRTRKRHQQEHRPQRPTESGNPAQHAKGRTGERPGPRKGAPTRRNVTQGVNSANPGGPAAQRFCPSTLRGTCSARAPAVTHWAWDPVGADEHRRCAAGAPGLVPWVPDPLRALAAARGGQQEQSNDPHNNQHSLNMPTTGRR